MKVREKSLTKLPEVRENLDTWGQANRSKPVINHAWAPSSSGGHGNVSNLRYRRSPVSLSFVKNLATCLDSPQEKQVIALNVPAPSKELNPGFSWSKRPTTPLGTLCQNP